MKAVPRLITLAAMLASVVTIVGGTLAATAVPSSGAPGGTNVCTGFTATANVVTGVADGNAHWVPPTRLGHDARDRRPQQRSCTDPGDGRLGHRSRDE